MRPPSLFPFKTALVVGALCYLVVRNPPFSVRWAKVDDLDGYNCEFYPLSSFPMYSGFDDADIHVFLTDGKDQPIRLQDLTNCQASALKKNYKGSLTAMKKKAGLKGRVIDLPAEIKEKAGKEVLHDILTSRAPAWAQAHPQMTVRLHEGIISVKDGAVVRSTRAVAEGSLETMRTFQPEVPHETKE